MRIGNVIANCIDASLVSSMPVFRTMARKTITAVVANGARIGRNAGSRQRGPDHGNPDKKIAREFFRPDEGITQSVAGDDLREGDHRQAGDQNYNNASLDSRDQTIEAKSERPQARHLVAPTTLLTRSLPSRSASSL